MLRTVLTLIAAAATAATPLTWAKTTRFAEMRLTLPAMIAHAPVLHDRVYRGELKAMAAFAKEAEENGDNGQPGRLERHVDYFAGAETPRLIGVSSEIFLDEHGVHPSREFDGVVFDKRANTRLTPLDLLKPGVDLRPLDKALCDAARAAKRGRDAEWVEKDDTNFPCPSWRGLIGDNGAIVKDVGPVEFTLATGDAPDKAAGLIFFYSEYQIGSYAEGAYEAIVPLAAFRAALKPIYAGEFGGGHPNGAKPFV